MLSPKSTQNISSGTQLSIDSTVINPGTTDPQPCWNTSVSAP